MSASSAEAAKQVAVVNRLAVCLPGGSPSCETGGSEMDKVIERLILDLIDWLVERERTYDQVTSELRDSHVKLHVWQEANRLGLIRTEILNELCIVKPTSLGLIVAELRRETRRHVRHSRSAANVKVRVNVLTMPSEPPPRRDPLFSDSSHPAQPASAKPALALCAGCGA